MLDLRRLQVRIFKIGPQVLLKDFAMPSGLPLLLIRQENRVQA